MEWQYGLVGLASGSITLVAGRFIARKKKADHRVVPGVEGLWHNYTFHEDGGADTVIDKAGLGLLAIGFVALPVVHVFRDYVLPRSFTPLGINLLIALLLGAASFATTWQTNKIDQYR